MDQPVDLTNLHEMTGNDSETEQLLFTEFFATFDPGVHALATSCEADATKRWYSQAHALKGVALNLGAAMLGELCRNAQDQSSAAATAKQAMAIAIREEYARVKTYLLQFYVPT